MGFVKIVAIKFSLSLVFLAITASLMSLISAVPVDTLVDSSLQVNDDPDVSDVEASAVDMSMYLTCDNQFELFVNGAKVCSGSDWQTTYKCDAKVSVGDVIAIDGRDSGGPAAFIGVFNGVPTKPSDWRCIETNSPDANWNSNSFDDSQWPKAVSFGRNDGSNVWMHVGGRSRPNIPAEAEWLWTQNNEDHNRVFCRYTPIPKPSVCSKQASALF
jgi:hypothetical protein